jgi:flagellar biosynthesis chaperone FliJ
MPRNPKYPLEPLREHRDRKVEHATAELGEAVRTREAADDAKRRAEQERVAAAARAATVRDDEAHRLAKGELHVADLARAQAWEHAASAEMADLERAIDRANREVGAAREREAGARTELAQKKADLDVVAKDQARFDAGVRRDQDANEEESADDVFAARRRQG